MFRIQAGKKMAARLFSSVIGCTRLPASLRLRLGLIPKGTSAFVLPKNAYFRTTGISTSKAQEKRETVEINFVDRDGDVITVNAKVGDTLLDVAKDNDVDLEGACEGTLSCSTCHIIFKPEEMAALNLDEPSDEELDMLDLAYGLEKTSRLGCQILVTKDFKGITLRVPEAQRDVRDL
ncbi:2Fe-2S ferredoxin-like [Acropora millepora]|nr:2Fe-2S ferredoxin-like [Acropora millepora]XP_029214456.2 2Fe-2S ferredoxin-like [Acropora millepora]